MQFIKKIIREELQKVIATLSEGGFYKDVESSPVKDDKENIIYNYENGRIFAGNNLEVDITNLNRYNLIEYLPKSPIEEMWSFELPTVHGTTLIVDIKRIIKSGNSLWSMKFGQLYRGEQVPVLIGQIPVVDGYDAFVDIANKNIYVNIDPSKF